MHGIFNIIYKDVTRRFCMYDAYSRMEILLGQKGVNRLSTAKIAVFGLGGAGSYTVEALARCGVGSLTLVDHEAITVTDINRQLYALQSTIGHKKVQIAKERVHNIDEDILVHTYETYYNEDTMGLFDLKAYDYIVDAMDTVSSKILLIEQAQKYQVPVISCLDMGNKLNPSSLEIMDISRVAADLAVKKMRAELRRKGVRRLKVLCSREHSRRGFEFRRNKENIERNIHGSISFVPGVAGLMAAGEVVRDILSEKHKK